MASLHEHIAEALGWELGQVRQFNFQQLREVVRSVSPKLHAELSQAIRSGSYLTGPRYRRRRLSGVW